ncbi:DUF6166 domain-containing protein [Peribacillus asahii]|uniref:DUF6166 domain-containing protein n=1 Tax=Peribacillus asahii TaxID=228899 RepID=UPI00207AF1F4|nr:DUF6166 domain-containing protein [Peribacillus asahii]USK62251.1 hypothetical protein LIT37_24055 [Peribacillus asahii]
MNIQLIRSNNGKPRTNIAHTIVKKAQEFDWGNTSEESADLALNILALFCDEMTREKLYRRFLNDVIARVPYGGCIISKAEIETWILTHSNFEDIRKNMSFLVAVYKSETEKNEIYEVEAKTEMEAVIQACEFYESEEYKENLIAQLTDFDELYDHYASREIWFSIYYPHNN